MLFPDLQRVSVFSESQILIDEHGVYVYLFLPPSVWRASCAALFVLPGYWPRAWHPGAGAARTAGTRSGTGSFPSSGPEGHLGCTAEHRNKHTKTIKRHEKPAVNALHGFSSSAVKATNSNSNTEILYTKVTPFCSVWYISTEKTIVWQLFYVNVKE